MLLFTVSVVFTIYITVTLTAMATISSLPDLPLLRIFSQLQCHDDVISAGQTCLRWLSLCHHLWTKIAQEVAESWSQEDLYPTREEVHIATVLGTCSLRRLLFILHCLKETFPLF